VSVDVDILVGPSDSLPLCDACGTEPAKAVVKVDGAELNACVACLFIGVEELAARRPPEARMTVQLDLRAVGFRDRPEIIETALRRLRGIALDGDDGKRIEIVATQLREIA
jgi:ribosome-binding protein aMBF1 (putative translation factor)